MRSERHCGNYTGVICPLGASRSHRFRLATTDTRSIQVVSCLILFDRASSSVRADLRGVVFVAIGSEVQVCRRVDDTLVIHGLEMFLAEAVVIVPGEAGGANRGLLGAERVTDARIDIEGRGE